MVAWVKLAVQPADSSNSFLTLPSGETREGLGELDEERQFITGSPIMRFKTQNDLSEASGRAARSQAAPATRGAAQIGDRLLQSPLFALRVLTGDTRDVRDVWRRAVSASARHARLRKAEWVSHGAVQKQIPKRDIDWVCPLPSPSLRGRAFGCGGRMVERRPKTAPSPRPSPPMRGRGS